MHERPSHVVLCHVRSMIHIYVVTLGYSTSCIIYKGCLKSPGTDVGAAGFGMGVPGLLRQTLLVDLIWCQKDRRQ